jgi:hypothetical protein
MKEETKTIEWTAMKLRKLKVAYRQAVTMNAEQFTFETHEFDTEYAKYFIEYLETQFPEERSL